MPCRIIRQQTSLRHGHRRNLKSRNQRRIKCSQFWGLLGKFTSILKILQPKIANSLFSASFAKLVALSESNWGQYVFEFVLLSISVFIWTLHVTRTFCIFRTSGLSSLRLKSTCSYLADQFCTFLSATAHST